MISSLMMYTRPETRDAEDRYWQHIHAFLNEKHINSPAALARHTDQLTVWRDPTLVLGQTCGLPYRLWLSTTVSLVGTPHYGLDGCEPGYYRSAIVVHADDDRLHLRDYTDAKFAFNQRHSQSGYAAAYEHLLPFNYWFTRQLETGSHAKAARAVATKAADIAFIDAVTWTLVQRYEPFAHRLRVIDWTIPTPGLPYITAMDAEIQSIKQAVVHAIASLSVDDRDTLLLQGLVSISRDTYLAVPTPPELSDTRLT